MGSEASELVPVGERELLEDRLAATCDGQGNPATVGRVLPPGDQTLSGHAVDESDDAVMPKLQLLGQRADRDSAAFGKPLDGEKCLMLPGRDPGGVRRVLAEAQKDPKGMPETRERLVLRPCDPRGVLRASTRETCN